MITEQNNIINIIIKKTKFLQTRFYLTIKTDLTDIEDFSFTKKSFLSNLIEVSQKATKDEIESILKFRKLFKALEIDSISNGFF